ncbi:unnamed protein product [Sphenostylis stenocarpa]|uniref:Uncharacterized protein n=1 Tax=Sphenostylis stenocarpa TaxID=92480 RepID=A0AA86RN47_9FABA|nr:unnamed protein product [Sphenostylis stenocarpa]
MASPGLEPETFSVKRREILIPCGAECWVFASKIRTDLLNDFASENPDVIQ